MARVVRAYRKPKGFTWGTTAGAVVLLVTFNITGRVPLLMLVAALLVTVVVDALVYRPIEKLMDNTIQIRDEA